MLTTTRNAIQDTFDASFEGRILFVEVVARLTAAGVESYRVDHRTRWATYYLPHGETLELPIGKSDEAIAEGFDPCAIVSAIRKAQQGLVKYPEFLRLTHLAGCVAHTVWFTSRQVTYCGRNGETHVERFKAD
jgi:uncharacterized protein YbcV (DUF1398 family)